jgi:hypothetical protein
METQNNKDGGQTSISPPLNVKNDNPPTIRALSSGIDTLYLTLNVDWSGSGFLSHLATLKTSAIESDKAVPGQIEDWLYLVQPYGRRGYEWLLESSEYTLRIGSWDIPKASKPSVIIEIRSEPLWRLGPEKAAGRILSLISLVSSSDLERQTVRDIKVSRADLCVDVLTPASFWNSEILQSIVCRAKTIRPFYRNSQLIELDGFKVGNGDLVARLYDKQQEIKIKSRKYWMYDIWEFQAIPQGWTVIRVEFQLMRQAIKDLGLDTPDDLFCLSVNLWAYCTQEWLKLQDRPGTHHTQRKTLQWWSVVQGGYNQVQGAYPLVRYKAIKSKQEHLIRQAYGLMTSLTALQQEQAGADIAELADFNDCLSAIFESLDFLGGERDFGIRVFEKRAKNSREYEKNAHIQELRHKLGFLSCDDDCNYDGGNNNES